MICSQTMSSSDYIMRYIGRKSKVRVFMSNFPQMTTNATMRQKLLSIVRFVQL